MRTKALLLTAIFGMLALPLFMPLARAHAGAAEYQAQSRMDSEDGEAGFHLVVLAKPLGLVTLVMALLTATLGLLMSRNPARIFKWHKRSAFTTIAVALCHGIVIFLTH